MNENIFALVVGALSCLALTSANAATFPNIVGPGPDLPNGAISFADTLTGFTPGFVFDADLGVDVPLNAFVGGQNTVGIPDVTLASAQSCFFGQSQENCKFASLGVGGTLTVEFVDNYLTGSGDATDDLWIYEIGPDIEDTFVEISRNGSTWIDVGKVTGSTKGVDIDAFGYGPTDLFRFVRLTDDPNEGNIDGETVGADIDAIAAISAVALVPVGVDVSAFTTGNKVYPNSDFPIALAVLGSSEFDVMQINPATVKLGFATTYTPNPWFKDVDNDPSSFTDGIFAFHTEETGIACNDTQVTLAGETFGGDLFQGTDTIEAMDCTELFCHPQ